MIIQIQPTAQSPELNTRDFLLLLKTFSKIQTKKGKVIKLSYNKWTKESEKLFLAIKPNGGLKETIQKVIETIGEQGNRWDFVGSFGSFRTYAEPPIKVLFAERKEIINILRKNGLLAN